MNRFFKNLLPFLYIIICVLPIVAGFGAVSAILLSALMTVLFVKHSFKAYLGFSIFSALALFLALSGNIYYFAVYLALSEIVSACLGACIKSQKTLAHTITAASLCAIIIFASVIIFYMKKYNISAVDVIFGTHFDALKEAALSAGELSAQITGMISTLQKQLDLLLPSLIVLSGAFFSYITFGIARACLEKSGTKVNMRPFYLLRLSASFTFIFIILDMISMFFDAGAFFANISTILTTLFVICGISVIDFHLKMKGVKTFLRIMIYVAAFLLISFAGFIGTLAINILHFVGLIDSLRPLRRIDSDKF